MTQERVAIIAAAAAPVGRYANRSPLSEQELLADIAAKALEDARVNSTDVGSAVFTTVTPNTIQQGFATHMAARLGLNCNAQLSQIMEMGITGGLAFDAAASDILLGRTQIALALGVSYASGGDPTHAMLQGLRVVGDAEFQAPFGATPIAWYAMDMQRYMHDNGVDRETIAHVALKSRNFARSNPLAQFKDPLSLEQVLSAREIVAPLGLYEVPAIADGAICLVLASETLAQSLGLPYVLMQGRGFCHDGRHQMGDTYHDMTEFPALRAATDDALKQAQKKLGDIDVAEIYAPCTITEILATETLGWFEKGQGAAACVTGKTSLNGLIPINTSGGCLSRGHPPALTALYGILEIREQLLGLSQTRQVKNARLGLTSCEAGNYNASIVHIFETPQ